MLGKLLKLRFEHFVEHEVRTRKFIILALARWLGEVGRARALEEFSGQSAVRKLKDVLAVGAS